MVNVAVGVMGSLPFAMSKGMSTVEQIKAYLDVCTAHNVKELDTARLYGQGSSEKMLGELHASDTFAVSTKILAEMDAKGTLKRERVLESGKASLKALDVKQVDIFYIHQPDPETPLKETLHAVDELYREGAFKRFGICHYKAGQVKEIYDICSKNNYVKPTVYQGGYNALSREPEDALFPTLRQLDIAFYGFGPTAGGTLAKPLKEILQPAEDSRWAALPIIKAVYGKKAVLDEVKKLHEECEKTKIPIGQASIRWLKFHSALGEKDYILLGASSDKQLEENLSAIDKGRLPDNVAAAFSAAYPAIQAASSAE